MLGPNHQSSLFLVTTTNVCVSFKFSCSVFHAVSCLALKPSTKCFCVWRNVCRDWPSIPISTQQLLSRASPTWGVLQNPQVQCLNGALHSSSSLTIPLSISAFVWWVLPYMLNNKVWNFLLFALSSVRLMVPYSFLNCWVALYSRIKLNYVYV